MKAAICQKLAFLTHIHSAHFSVKSSNIKQKKKHLKGTYHGKSRRLSGTSGNDEIYGGDMHEDIRNLKMREKKKQFFFFGKLMLFFKQI